jgi:hypothetical protein
MKSHYVICYWAGPLDGGAREMWVEDDGPPLHLYLSEDRGRYRLRCVTFGQYVYTWEQG